MDHNKALQIAQTSPMALIPRTAWILILLLWAIAFAVVLTSCSLNAGKPLVQLSAPASSCVTPECKAVAPLFTPGPHGTVQEPYYAITPQDVLDHPMVALEKSRATIHNLEAALTATNARDSKLCTR